MLWHLTSSKHEVITACGERPRWAALVAHLDSIGAISPQDTNPSCPQCIEQVQGSDPDIAAEMRLRA